MRPPRGPGGQRSQSRARLYGQGRKNDRLDAQNLARLARLDPKLLAPLKHRGETSQAHLAIVRSREALIEARAKLINHLRGTLKSFGFRLPGCSSPTFHKKVGAHVPEPLKPALEPLLKTIASMTERIQEYDRQPEVLAEESYPETNLLRRVHGIGTLTALAFVLTLEDPSRFGTGRAVGAYLGLVPRVRTNRANATRRSASPSRATGCSGGSW